ncbi:MAG: pyridoxal phosphate-dependent aminotransferase [Anaerolineales bacterium]|uniref:Aminotransferase n=1 Tax=Candidatus Desulfolinea nitratireducens TaxID=2841698 RepID=A0A8J6NRT4_9CHLR|nr:pyridoxal phosphate-dependent aminotransferase [Candidatus Desulfolinea nitratireducens]MBL6962170.1 pyridoxal phosphate-dependent aminotransferase [Anaerolineales bacterium]
MNRKSTKPTSNIRSRIENLYYSPTLAINDQVQNIRDDGLQILHLGFGQSPFPVHPVIQSALQANVDKNLYLPSAGLPELRHIAKNYFSKSLGFDGEGYEAIIGPGSKELLFDIQMVVDGDLLLPVPSWVSYAPQAMLIEDRVIKIPTVIAENYHITAERLENAIQSAIRDGKNPRKLIVNSPNNPTGLILPPAQISEIVQICRTYNILVISDEIYGLVDYKRDHVSIARFYPEGTIVTSGLSKHLSLGGFRLGIILIPKTLMAIYDGVLRVASETWSCVSAPIQFASIQAFKNDSQIEDYIRSCTRIHALVSQYVRDALANIGVDYPDPQGAFYLYPDFEPFRVKLRERGIETSDQLAIDLLMKTHIASLPGTSFGDEPGKLRLRLASCDFDGQTALDFFRDHPSCSPEKFVSACCPNIKLACERLESYFFL